MRFVLATAVALSLSLSAAAQDFDHIRVENLTNGQEVAQELEYAGFGVVEGGTQPDSVELHATIYEQTTLQNMGYELTMIAKSQPLQEIMQDQAAEGVPTGYPTLAEILATMALAESNFPAIAKLINATQTYGAPQTHDGHDMFIMKISDNVGVEEDEPTMLVIPGHHSNEVNTNPVGLHAIAQFTEKYGVDPDLTAIVDNNELFIAVTWNPDGLEYVHFVSQNWRKNRRNNGGSFGVDLNRNYAAGWNAACSGSTSGSSGNYKGPSAFSEPETQTLRNMSLSEHFTKVVDFHSSGRETLWEFNCTLHPWASYMLQTAQLMSAAAGYGNAERPPSAEGENYEWQFTQGHWAHLIEIGASQQPTWASAQTEARQVFGAIQWMAEQPYRFSGHVTDACSGAPVDTTIKFVGVNPPFGGTFSTHPVHGRYDIMPAIANYTVQFSAPGYTTQSIPVNITGAPVVLDVALVPNSSVASNYCTPGTSASGCQSTLSAAGTASASAASGFVVTAADVEGTNSGQFYFGTSGPQANPWGNSSSYRCVMPPTKRGGVMAGGGTNGGCDGTVAQDLNAMWTAKPAKNPGAGATVNLQFWYRDPQNTSNRTTSFSDALEFGVCP
jgi:hypothetical protein